MEKNFMDFADMVAADENLQPIMDAIEQIMSIPEESLNDTTIEIMSGMISGAITDNIRRESVKSLLENFEESGFTRAQAAENIQNSKTAIEEALNELNPSPNKRKIFDSIFNAFYDIFDTALSKYHTYAFDLPVKLEKGAKAPTYAHETDACADIYALEDTIIPAHSLSNLVHTGLRIALPENWVFMIDPRSSIGFKTGLRLSNSIGIIDEDYRGEIGLLYDNISDSNYEIKAGDRIAQCWVQPVHRFRPVEVDILPATTRGEGGFGSTGK